ncbi:prenyltransferase/squalene oxidase repeat-containing protein [Streptomyces sp. NPDC020141]|uniref:prenyltransferase/squalene oxidase repeat-containing protein n=1 Tax=Streptomyces sp. NPDC020141 TaxID=3365065 RepID=UPI00379A6559
MTTVRRRGAAALAASAVLGVAVASAASPAAAAPTPSPSAALPAGLYGTGDPTYDGVWRQALALLAQDTVGVTPAEKAVEWLTGQQCDNGAFAAYRADTKAACAAKLPLDSNATAAAVQALAALGGQDETVKKSVDWLTKVQNADGGWGYNPGGASDANSTSIVIGALAAAGAKPGEVTSKDGKSPYDALLTFATPCGGENGGAFVFQPKQPGIVADSTAAAVVAAKGEGLAAKAGAKDSGDSCEPAKTIEGAAHNGAVYLATALAKTGHLLTPPMPGSDDPSKKPDFGNTADAVVALTAQGMADRAKKPLEWLEANAADWAKESGPAAYAQLILAAEAAGADPKSFGTTDLVAGLNATGPEPRAEKASKDSDAAPDSDSGSGMWWFVGAFFAAAVGVGVLFGGRRKSQR